MKNLNLYRVLRVLARIAAEADEIEAGRAIQKGLDSVPSEVVDNLVLALKETLGLTDDEMREDVKRTTARRGGS